MKKLISLFLVMIMTAALFTGCASGNSSDKTVVRLGGLKGPTSMGMVKLLDDAENGRAKSKIEFTIAGSPDELVPKLTGKDPELDIAALPANLASVLYNKTDGAIQFLAVNTLGVIYIVEKGEPVIHSIADLKGQTIYATGKGSTPEHALNYLLAENGLEPGKDVTMQWKSEPPEVIASIAKEDHAVAMMPQPFVTVAQGKVEGLNISLDLTEEWEKLDNGSQFITAGLVARREFVENHPEAVAQFLREYEASTKFINSNIVEGAKLIEKYGIVKAAIAEKAIPFCNITYIAGKEMIPAMQGYLKVLFDQNPKAVGGALPGDDFYYAP